MREYLIRNRYILTCLSLAALAFFVKLYLLNMRSVYIDPDEGYYLLLARNLLHGQGYAFNGLPNIMMPPVVPLLIAALSLIVNSYQLSLSILTAFSGSLLGILVFLISRKRLSPGMSVAACFLSLFIFQMNAFLPLNEPYRETLYRGSDIINCLFVVAGIYFALKFAETNRGSHAALAGLSFGLSYLTRPEGVLLFLAAFCLLLLLSFVVSTKISKTKLLWFALAYIIVSMPYVVCLRSVTGRWTLSGKIGAARSYRVELLNVIQRNDWEAFKRNHYSLDKNRLEMNDWYFGYYPKEPPGKEQTSSAKGSELLENIRLYPIVPKVLFPPYLFFVGILGIGYSLYAAIKKRALNDLILFAVFPYSVLVAALSYPIPRHHLFLVPFVCYFGLAGLEGIRCRLRSLSLIVGRTVTVGIWVLIIVSTGNEYLLKFQEYRHSKPRVEASFLFESEIGSYLHNRNAGVVMSTYPSIAIRVGSDWQVLPLGAIDDVFAFAKKKRVDYIVSMDRQTKRNIIIDMGRSAQGDVAAGAYGLSVMEKHRAFDVVRIEDKGDR